MSKYAGVLIYLAFGWLAGNAMADLVDSVHRIESALTPTTRTLSEDPS